LFFSHNPSTRMMFPPGRPDAYFPHDSPQCETAHRRNVST
jgi:hypothetical protein